MKSVIAITVALLVASSGPVIAKAHTAPQAEENNNSPDGRGVNQVPPGQGGCAPDCAPGQVKKNDDDG